MFDADLIYREVIFMSEFFSEVRVFSWRSQIQTFCGDIPENKVLNKIKEYCSRNKNKLSIENHMISH
jgi:hypothetical protein